MSKLFDFLGEVKGILGNSVAKAKTKSENKIGNNKFVRKVSGRWALADGTHLSKLQDCFTESLDIVSKSITRTSDKLEGKINGLTNKIEELTENNGDYITASPLKRFFVEIYRITQNSALRAINSVDRKIIHRIDSRVESWKKGDRGSSEGKPKRVIKPQHQRPEAGTNKEVQNLLAPQKTTNSHHHVSMAHSSKVSSHKATILKTTKVK